MRRTKKTTILLVVLAILALGIGYAAATNQLQINGTLGATAPAGNLDVEFTNAHVVADNTTNKQTSAEIDAIDSLKATFSATGFTHKDEHVDIFYTVRNNSTDYAAELTASVEETFTYNDHFAVTAKFMVPTEPNGDNDLVDGPTTIQPGEEVDVVVRVECIKTPVEDLTAAEAEGIVKINAVATEAESVNPNA